MEVRLPDVIIRFDGQVIEIFGRSENGSGRFHVDTLQDISVEDGILTIIHRLAAARTILSVGDVDATGLVTAVQDAMSRGTPLG